MLLIYHAGSRLQVLRTQPDNIYLFGARYFAQKIQERGELGANPRVQQPLASLLHNTEDALLPYRGGKEQATGGLCACV